MRIHYSDQEYGVVFVGFQAYHADSEPLGRDVDWYDDDGIQEPASYYLGCYDGTLHGKSRTSSTYLDYTEDVPRHQILGIPSGSTIEGAYDREARTISFNVDGCGHKVAFTHVREPALRAMCRLQGDGKYAAELF